MSNTHILQKKCCLWPNIVTGEHIDIMFGFIPDCIGFVGPLVLAQDAFCKASF